MADPTNINIAPTRAAIPTNLNVPDSGTHFTSGVVGNDCVINLVQGYAVAIAAGVTDEVVCKTLAPFRGYIRKVVIYGGEVGTGTHQADVYNNTQSAAILTDQTITDDSINAYTTITTPNVNEDDEIRLRVTTPASTGAADNVQCWIYLTQIEGSTDNPL